MSPSRSDKNLFENSTMTFGEHLEELRACLFKSLIALVICFILGLFVGSYVVEFIQRPLTTALSKYYEEQSAGRIETKLSGAQESGEPLYEDPAAIKRRVEDDHMLAEEFYVDPDAMMRELKNRYPHKFANIELPSSSQSGTDTDQKVETTQKELMPIMLWHRTADDPRVQVKSFNVHEGFVIYVKASLLVGVLLASPYIFYQLWTFVAAGLYPHEKKYVHVFLPVSLGLFLLGACLAFFFVFEPVLQFLFGINKALGIGIEPRISEWLNFVLILPLGFGISFQLPLVMLFLERIGIFNVEVYLSKFRIAILVIFVIAMFLTPADPTSMFLMALPLTILYFVGILLCKFMPRSQSPFDME